MGYTIADLDELSTFFKEQGTIETPVKMGQGVEIVDVNLFIRTQLTTLRSRMGEPIVEICYERLLALKAIVTERNKPTTHSVIE